MTRLCFVQKPAKRRTKVLKYCLIAHEHIQAEVSTIGKTRIITDAKTDALETRNFATETPQPFSFEKQAVFPAHNKNYV